MEQNILQTLLTKGEIKTTVDVQLDNQTIGKLAIILVSCIVFAVLLSKAVNR